MSTGLGQTIFNRASEAPSNLERINKPDFETRIKRPDASNEIGGVFIRDVAIQIAYDKNNNIIGTYNLKGAVAVNQATATSLEGMGKENHRTNLVASALANADNLDLYDRVARNPAIARWERVEVSLESWLVPMQPKTSNSFTR